MCHWTGPGPRKSDQPKGSFHDRAVRWIDEHRAGSYVAQRLAVDHVAVLLEESRERRIEKRDALEPLHRRHPVPAGHDQPKWPPVLGWDRLALHQVCNNNIVAEGVIDRQRPLVADPPSQVFRRALVGTAEEQLDRPGRDRHPGEDVAESRARPRRGPDGAEAPLLTGPSRVEISPAVSGTLERHHYRLRRQRADLVERDRRRSRPIDEDRSRTGRDWEVRPNIVAPRRSDRWCLLVEARLRVQRLLAQDQKIAVAH